MVKRGLSGDCYSRGGDGWARVLAMGMDVVMRCDQMELDLT